MMTAENVARQRYTSLLIQFSNSHDKTHLHDPAAWIAPESCMNLSPLEIKGRRECRAPEAPAALCAK
jgi:hypothetical protein